MESHVGALVTFQAELNVDPTRTRGQIDPRIYGQFVEHVGRAIYGGIFEPASSHSDENGYRLDLIEAAKVLSPPLLRWPGGNFASGYNWTGSCLNVDGGYTIT